MPIVKKMLLITVVAGIFAQAGSSEIDSLPIDGGFSLKRSSSASSRLARKADSENFRWIADELDLNLGSETLSSKEGLAACDFNLKHCGITTADSFDGERSISGAIRADSSAIMMSDATAPTTRDRSVGTSLLLLFLGLIGISRLRGRPVN